MRLFNNFGPLVLLEELGSKYGDIRTLGRDIRSGYYGLR